MQHKTLAMQEDADPFGFPVNHGICHLDAFHMSLIALVPEVLVNGKIVEVVGAFEVFGSSPQSVEFCRTDTPSSFASQFLQPSSEVCLVRGFAVGLPAARSVNEIPELVNGRLAVLLTQGVEETRPWPWRNE